MLNLKSEDEILKLSNLDIKKLIDIYIKLSNPIYYKTHDNMDNILKVLLDIIIKKLDDISLIEVIDIYTNIFGETLITDENIENNNNVIIAKRLNLQDDFIVDYESKKSKIICFIVNMKKKLIIM